MKFILFPSVVMLLSSAQGLTVNSVPDGLTDPRIILNDELVPQELNFTLNGKPKVLYQGDMILSDEQWRLLRQRKAIADISKLWPKTTATGMIDIDYRYDDATVNKTAVQKAIATLEAATCIRFREISSAVAKPHLIMKTHPSACSAALGYQANQNGQDVNLAAMCYDDSDLLVHELGHALGLNHEQSRSDRDEYVLVFTANIQAGMEDNFAKEITNNYGLPYDYSSMMHYFPLIFSKNQLYTIVTKDPQYMPLIDKPAKITFMDKKILNLMYKCTDTWLAGCGNTNLCQNQGYTKAGSKAGCTCECPAGTSGAQCETLNLPYNVALLNAVSPGNQRITTESTVTSPGYPTPVTTDSSRIIVIEAPECYVVKLTMNVFDMSDKAALSVTPGGPTTQECYDMILAIQKDDPPQVITKYCASELTAGMALTSAGRFMVLTYTTKALAGNTKKGFSAAVTFIAVPPAAGCTPTGTTTTTTTPATTTTTRVSSAGRFINSGPVPLITSASNGQCSLVPSSTPSVYSFRNPNYPNNYDRSQGCSISVTTTEPRYLKVTPLTVQLGWFDSLGLSYPYRNTGLNGGSVGTATTIATSSSKLNFQSCFISPTGKFDINVEVVNTPCHQVIVLDAASTGPLSIPANYPAGTICEWWLRAPAGRKVQVAFSSFSMGDFFCFGDFLAIDLAGDSKYATSARRYCGGFSPGTVVSTDNALNILVNGQRGNSPGLNAIYTVV